MANKIWALLLGWPVFIASAMAGSPAVSASDDRETFNAWVMVEPKFSAESRAYRQGEVLLEARLAPAESIELTTDAATRDGDILVPRGTQLMRVWASNKKIYCTTEAAKAWGSKLRRPVLVRLCFIEDGASGKLSEFYDNRNIEYGLPMVRKPYSDAPIPLRNTEYRELKPNEFRAQYFIQIRNDVDRGAYNKSCVMAFVGPNPPKTPLDSKVPLYASVAGKDYDVGGAKIHIDRYGGGAVTARVLSVTQKPIVIYTPWLLF